MAFTLNVASALLAVVAAALAYWASTPFPNPSWRGNAVAEQRHRERQKILVWTMFAIVILIAAIQIYLAYVIYLSVT